MEIQSAVTGRVGSKFHTPSSYPSEREREREREKGLSATSVDFLDQGFPFCFVSCDWRISWQVESEETLMGPLSPLQIGGVSDGSGVRQVQVHHKKRAAIP